MYQRSFQRSFQRNFYTLHLIRINPLHRKHRTPIFLGDAQDDVPAAPVVNVVRERSQGVENLFGIPPLLVLDTSPLHLAVVDQIVYVYGKRQGRLSLMAVFRLLLGFLLLCVMRVV